MSAVPLQWALQAAIAGALVLSMLGPAMTMSSGDQLDGGGNAIRQLAYLAITALATIGLRPLDAPRRLLAVPWPYVLALGYCVLTLSWSAVPGTGARRLILTVLSTWTIFAATSFVPFYRTVTLMRIVLGGAIIGNIAIALLYPQMGVHQANDVLDKNLIGDWCGFMSQKNITGAATGLAVLLFVYGGGRLSIFVRGFFIALGFFLLWKTGSRTSLGMTVAAAGVGALFTFYSARYRAPVVIAAIIGTTFVASLTNIFNYDHWPDFSDRKTLSGRIDIWNAIIHYLETHHWIGAGYGSFWDVGPVSPVYQYAKGWVTALAQGHNGYLDLLATIGLPGLAIVLFSYVIFPLFKLVVDRNAQGARGALIISIITFCVGHNATESTLMDRDSIPQIVLTFSIALLYNLPWGRMRQTFSFAQTQDPGSATEPPTAGAEPEASQEPDHPAFVPFLGTTPLPRPNGLVMRGRPARPAA